MTAKETAGRDDRFHIRLFDSVRFRSVPFGIIFGSIYSVPYIYGSIYSVPFDSIVCSVPSVTSHFVSLISAADSTARSRWASLNPRVGLATFPTVSGVDHVTPVMAWVGRTGGHA